MKKTVGKKFRRALHFDFHTSPGIKNIFGNFDAKRFASQLAAANVEYINMAARCNMGYSYYNTKVGKKYEGLGDRDPLAEMIEACHEKGIGFTAYFNVGLNHELAADDPSLLKIDRYGRIYKDNKKDNFFRLMCYNSAYRQHFLAEIKEVCQYDIDGIFCDCFALTECYCPKCMADMKKRGVNIDDEKAVLSYQNEVRYEFAREIYEALGDKKDKIKFFINGISWTSGFRTHAEVECLTTDGAWGYDFFDSQAAYTRTMYEDRVYMSGRFQNSWGDFGGVKPVASMQNDLYDAMMNSFGISYGDHLHPVDGFENEVASRIGKVMKEKLAYEKYTENSDNVVEVGLIIHSSDVNARLPHFVTGAARMLKELKLTYNVYDENGRFERDGVKLLIVCDNAGYGDEFNGRLADFAKNGGKIIFTGSGIDLGKELGLLDFVEIVGADTRDNAYYAATGSDMRWAMYNTSRVIRNIDGKEMAKDVSNMLNFTWDGRQSCFYRPQGEPTEYSAAVIKGNVACICFDIFDSYADNLLIEHRELFESLADELICERLIYSPAMPKTATSTITRNGEYTVFHVKSTYPEHKVSRGIIEEHVYMRSVPVSLLGEYEVYSLPELTRLESRCENGRTLFETGDITGYKAFLLK